MTETTEKTGIAQAGNEFLFRDRILFQDRPPLPSRACSYCGGCGKVTDSYFLHPSPDLVSGAPAGAVHAFVAGTAHIGEACREAGEIARRSGRPVAFEFSSFNAVTRRRTVVVRPSDDPDAVTRAWWIAEYGKTPEESLAER